MWAIVLLRLNKNEIPVQKTYETGTVLLKKNDVTVPINKFSRCNRMFFNKCYWLTFCEYDFSKSHKRKKKINKKMDI